MAKSAALKLVIGDGLTDEQLATVVRKTIAEGDQNGDGELSLKEFMEFVGKLDLTRELSVKF